MITDLLPRYNEAFNAAYRPLRVITVEGHETGWMETTGKTYTGKPYVYREVQCECTLTEGTGWQRKDGRVSILGTHFMRNCLPRRTALYLRRLELRQQFSKQYCQHGAEDSYDMLQASPNIIADMIELAKAGEFLGEDGSGASDYNGYFYVNTYAEIIGRSVKDVWPKFADLTKAKKIGMDGNIVTAYRPEEPYLEDSV